MQDETAKGAVLAGVLFAFTLAVQFGLYFALGSIGGSIADRMAKVAVIGIGAVAAGIGGFCLAMIATLPIVFVKTKRVGVAVLRMLTAAWSLALLGTPVLAYAMYAEADLGRARSSFVLATAGSASLVGWAVTRHSLKKGRDIEGTF